MYVKNAQEHTIRTHQNVCGLIKEKKIRTSRIICFLSRIINMTRKKEYKVICSSVFLTLTCIDINQHK
jgi:hypothetical protein